MIETFTPRDGRTRYRVHLPGVKHSLIFSAAELEALRRQIVMVQESHKCSLSVI